MHTVELKEDPLMFLFTSIKLHKFRSSIPFLLWFYSVILYQIIMITLSVLSIFYWKDSPLFMKLQYLPNLGMNIMSTNSCLFFIFEYNKLMDLTKILNEEGLNLRAAGEYSFRMIQKFSYDIRVLITPTYAVMGVAMLSTAPYHENDKLWQPFTFLIHKYFGYFILIPSLLVVPIFMYAMIAFLNTSNYTIFHINFQFRILNYHVIRLARMSERNKDRIGYQETMYKEIVNLVRIQEQIMKLTDKMLNHADLRLLSILLTLLLMFLCIAGFVIFNVDPPSNWRMVLPLIPMTTFSVWLCLNGQLVKNESEKVYHNSLECRWYHWNKKNRRAYLMFLTNMKPMRFTKSGVFDIDFLLFTFICKTSYTLFTLFVNVSGR